MLKQLLAAVARSAKVLLTELQRVFGFGSDPLPEADAQLLVNRTVAAAAVIVAVVITCLPGDKFMAKTIANALFSVATWLWTGKEPDANSGRVRRDLKLHPELAG